MSEHMQREMEDLKKNLVALCALVEDQVQTAVRSLTGRDTELARSVENRDLDVDQREVEVEEQCIRMLTLYQPVAGDLRLIVSALKINNDLERIGDLAVNIAHKALALAKEPPPSTTLDLAGMGEKSRSMLHDSIEAMVKGNSKLADEVCDRDDEVDAMKRQIRLECEKMIQEDPALARPLMKLMAASRNLERIADCATNIAEDVIYMVEGRIARHGEGG